jgi:hypothetical protein
MYCILLIIIFFGMIYFAYTHMADVFVCQKCLAQKNAHDALDALEHHKKKKHHEVELSDIED